MKRLMDALLACMESGRDAMLVTVVGTGGSAPRGAGARMLVDARGYVCGTIGGGPSEFDAVQRARSLLKLGQSTLHTYHLSPGGAEAFGACGGSARVHFGYLAASDAALLERMRGVRAALDQSADAWLTTDLTTGEMTLTNKRPAPGGARYAQKIADASLCYVFGCGHVARALIPVLARAGFAVVALDDRAQFADPALLEGAREVRLIDFADPSHMDGVGPLDDVIIMTRGHEHDYEVLIAALRTPARYIGMMGSLTKRESTFARAKAAGFIDADLTRVHCPIGLPILAETPFEIALSIACELVCLRAKCKPTE